MKMSRIAVLGVSLAALAAALIGCGTKAYKTLSPDTGIALGHTAGQDIRVPASDLTFADLCGHILLHDCEQKPTGVNGVTVTATWSNGSKTTTTDVDGKYCFSQLLVGGGTDVTVCVDPSTLPPNAHLESTHYDGAGPNCQVVHLVENVNVDDADFVYSTCGPPPPPPCTIPGSINSNFNGTAVVGTSSGPATIWFNSNFSMKNAPAGTHVFLTNSHVTINGEVHHVPNAIITFANVPCATTHWDDATDTWNTTVPLAGSDEIFLAGRAWQVTNLPGGARVTWDGTFATDRAGVCISWKWGAAAYKYWTDYNDANIKVTHNNSCNVTNGDHAGTPENVTIQKSVTGGARGGGGSNFTGSWSGTATLCPPCGFSR